MHSSGGPLNRLPITSELDAHSYTHLKQGSDFILLQIRLNSWLLKRRHGETVVPRGELLAGWNHEVSRCHSSFRRRLGDLKCRKCAPGRRRPSHVKFRQVCVKCGAGDSESGSSWRRVSPGPSPACRLTDSVAVASPHEPMPQRLCDRDYKSSAYWLPVLTAPRPLPLIHRALPSTIFNETVVCVCALQHVNWATIPCTDHSYCAFC